MCPYETSELLLIIQGLLSTSGERAPLLLYIYLPAPRVRYACLFLSGPWAEPARREHLNSTHYAQGERSTGEQRPPAAVPRLMTSCLSVIILPLREL